ncbi:hypothetical protein AB0B88_10360 [Micromonospora haikouensis]|uniref:hypothetical protein n=1 Tax=Micromonospora haikouensis TaxID=686309 RepID=UPI0033C1DF83
MTPPFGIGWCSTVQLMFGGVTRPLIFVDIDGVLLPLRARPAGVSSPVILGAVAASGGSGNPLLDAWVAGQLRSRHRGG